MPETAEDPPARGARSVSAPGAGRGRPDTPTGLARPPQPGRLSPSRRCFEHQRWFGAAQRFRSGIEGRISQLRRARRLNRCLNHGWSGARRIARAHLQSGQL